MLTRSVIARRASGDARTIAAAAVVARLTFLAVMMSVFPFPFERWVAMRDGWRYLETAAYMRSAGAVIVDADLTLPGYPVLINVVGTLLGGHYELAALVLTILCVGLAAWMFARLCADLDIATGPRWIFALLPPVWLLYGSMVMSEGLFLALATLSAFLALSRHRLLMATLVASAATLVRVQGVFLFVAILAVAVRNRQWREAVRLVLVFVALPTVWLVYSQITYGESLLVADQYPAMWLEGVFAWPFVGLVETALDASTPVWKSGYIGAHVVLVLVGCAVAVWRLRAEPSAVTLFVTVWLVGNTACQLCLGSIWGFHEFHRFMLAAWPALVLTVGRGYRPSVGAVCLMSVVSVGLSVVALVDS